MAEWVGSGRQEHMVAEVELAEVGLAAQRGWWLDASGARGEALAEAPTALLQVRMAEPAAVQAVATSDLQAVCWEARAVAGASAAAAHAEIWQGCSEEQAEYAAAEARGAERGGGSVMEERAVEEVARLAAWG